MKKFLRTSVVCLIALCSFLSHSVQAQNPSNIKIEYQDLNTIPDKLNVCGAADEVTVILTPTGTNNDLRSNITAKLNLFKGVRFVKLIESKSTPGVKMLDTSNINMPLFGLPNLTATGEVTQIKITYQISADCGFLDTLAKNNNLQVYDTWNVKYDLGTQKNLSETEQTAEYRDAFEVPIFSLSVLDKFNTPLKADDCVDRNIQVTNSGLEGSVVVFTYSVTYGPGLTYKGISVNDKIVDYTKVALPNGDTIITFRVTGGYFKTNKIGNNPGNGDGVFDPNENLIIKEKVCVANCNLPTYSKHSVAWGCYGKECDVKVINSLIPVGVGTPNPIFTYDTNAPNQAIGYCQQGVTSVTYRNQGTEVDPGFGTMYDVITGIGIGGKFEPKILGYKVSSLTIAGKTIPFTTNTLIDLGKNPVFKTDPDGPGGLEDADKDGYFDDLKIGQSYTMTFKYDYLCAENKDTFFCTNPRNVGVSALSSYKNACNERLDKINENYINVSNNNNGFEDVSDPDALIAKNDTFLIHHIDERSLFFFEKNCDGKEELYAKVYLPKGVIPVIGQTALFKNASTTPLVMKSNKISNDTLYLSFDATEPFLGGKYDLQMAFFANATAQPGFTKFPFEFGFYCPKCDCKSVWYCNTINGPKLHISDACVTGICPKGVRTTSFDIKRRTFGYTDATFKTKFDPAKANKKVAISCDSVEIRINGEVGDAAITTGLGVGINYSAIIEKDVPLTNLGQILKFGKGKLIINGTTTCDIDGTKAKFVPSKDKKLRIDLSDCLKSKNITLNKCDKIQFIGSFAIDPDGPYSVQFKYIPNLRGFLYSSDNGSENSCDDFGDNFVVSKNKTLFDFPSSANFPKGCATVDMDYKLITVNNGFKDYFGKEYRQAVRPDSIYIKFDPAMLNAFEKLDVSYSIPGHPIFGNNPIPLGTLKTATNGKFSLNFDTVQYRIPALNNISYYSFLFRISAVPNCKAVAGSSKGDNRFDFDATFKYKDRYYAKEIGDGSCSPDSTVFVDNDVYYTEPPTLSFSPVSNPNFDLVGDTAVWTVKICNTSIKSDAGSTFLAIENPNAKLDIIAMDLLDGNKFTPLVVKKYGTGNRNAFALNKGLKASDGLNPVSEICATVRIKALVKTCGSLQVQALTGWNCTLPTNPNWNPSLHPPCEDLQQTLRVIGQEPMLDALLDEGFNKNPDLCDTVYLDLLVRNTGKANAFDIKTNIWLPTLGATLVPGSVQIAYPSGATFKTIPNPTKGTPSTKGTVYTYDNFKGISDYLDKNGLKAYNVANPTDSNEFKIRYRVVTDCEFKSGSLSFFAVQGRKGCGEPTNLETGESKPIKIKGALLTNNQRIFDIKITDNTLIVPTLISLIELEVTNTTNNPSEATDLMTITLPKGILYEAGTTKGTVPAGYAPGDPAIKVVGGQQVLTWPIAQGLVKGQKAVLSFFTTTPDFDCENVPVFDASIVTVVKRSIVCKSNPSGAPCIIDVITSSGGETFIELPVSTEGALGIEFKKVTSICAGNGTEKILIKGNLVNLDSIPFPDFPIDVTYFYDENDNGKLDSLDEIIKLFSEKGPLDIGQTQPVSHEITVDGKRVCTIRAQVNAEGTTCGAQTFALPAPQLLIGVDKDFCAFPGDDIQTSIGETKCNDLKYKYIWQAFNPAFNSFISDINAVNPTVKFKWSKNLPDTIGFYVSIDRGTGCDLTYDTMYIFRSTINIPKASVSILNDKLCAGLSTTLTAKGGTKYEWIDANGLVFATTATLQITPKATTKYTVKVANDAGCKDTTSIVVTPIPTPNVTASPDITICFGTMKPISASVSGGTNNYSFNWTPALGLNNPILANPVAKPAETTVYTVTAIDANGCKGSDEVRVQVDTCTKCMPPTLDLTQITKAMCGMANGSIQVYPWGGHLDKYTYKWSPNVGKSSGFGEARYDLPAGVYTLDIALKDDTTCNNSFKIVVPNSGNFAEAKIILGNISNPSCGSTSNGFVNFAVIYPNNFDFPADTVITDGTKNYKNGDLPVGQFFINIFNKNKCLTTSQPFAITNADNGILAIVPKVTDACDSLNVKGAIDLTVTGGTSPFVYNWADIPTGVEPEDRTGLTKGIYSVTVSDAKGCTVANTSEVKTCKTNGGNPTGGGNPKDSTLTVTIKLATNVKCFADANGKVEVVLKGDSTLMATAKGVIKDNAGKEYNNGSLVAGDYIYIVYTANGKKLGSAPFKITQPDLIVAKATATEVCKTNLGTITLDISGGTKPYEFVWEDLATNQTQNRTGLVQGLYSVQIKDAYGCIRNLVDIAVGKCKDSTVIINPTAKDTAIVLTLKSVLATKCFGDANGSVEVTMKGDSTNIATSTYIISDKTGKKYDNGKLPAGDYLFIVSNSKGKAMDTVAFVIKQPIALIATAKVTDVCKTTLGTIELTVDGGVNPYAYKWDDLSSTITDDNRTGLSKGSYTVQISDANDCIFEVKDIVVGVCKDTTNVNPNVPCTFDAFAGKETLIAFIPTCDDLAAICVPLTKVKTINVDGKDTPITPCVGSFYSAAPLLKGTSFVIKDWTLGSVKYSGAAKSIKAIVDSLNTWDAVGNWAYDSDTKHITGGAASKTYGILNIQDVSSAVPQNYGLNYTKGVDGTLLKLYKGDHIIIAKNDKNCTDTLKISIKCDFKAPKPDTIYLTMLITESKTACLDVSELFGAPVSVTEGCMNQYLADATMLANNCIKFTGVNLGTDTICFTSCDANGICDITYIILDVNKPFKDVIDTISVSENKKYCIHPSDYGIEGAFTMKTTCDQKVDGNISFTADQNGCIEYVGLKTGNDTICVEVCDKAGKCGNFKIFVNVRPQIIIPGTGSQDIIFKDTILIGDMYDYCAPLPLGFVPVSIKNNCPKTSGNASFDLNDKTFCVKYTGLIDGIDTACITLCDANKDCFNVKMIIWVEKIIVMPLARDDHDTTVVGGKIFIDEMKNDIIPGKLVEMKLLSKPRLGSLVTTNTMKMEYSNNKDECGVIDTFNYYICNQDGCDTAKVSIYIRCAKVKVYTGFSPNGDDANETFTIMDIDQFPSNELRIFNRWGNEVMFEKGYKNTWKGTWNNQNLPDGTYFYILDLGDKEHTMFSGYLQIQR
jgi:gliding motility-associated-like protein